MKKITEYGLGVLCLLQANLSYAAEKFEVLPDLPDPLAAYAQSAEAASVSGAVDSTSILGTQSVGHEISLVSAFFALLLTIVLIYLFVIILSKFNKANIKLMRQQQRELSKYQASVVSTTALGNNKTLHVIELDGKRMLIGASSNTIQLIKDLGSISSDEQEEFSHIEIPTIKIPKIEIPKIEIPSIGFSKLATKIHKEFEKSNNENSHEEPNREECDEGQKEAVLNTDSDNTNSDGIIDTLFTQSNENYEQEKVENTESSSEHIVDPDEFVLHKKYLN